jgi:hypothetical protein
MSGRIQKLERRLTGTDEDNMSDLSESPSLTPRPDSPSSLPLSPSRPASSRRESRITLEAELKKSRQAEEVGHTFITSSSSSSIFKKLLVGYLQEVQWGIMAAKLRFVFGCVS